MRPLILAVIAAAFCAAGNAQDFNHYKTLLPQGPVPRDFTERSSVKVNTEVTTLTGEKARIKKTKRQFYLESTFSIDDFLTGGSVLFNDDLSVYTSSVLSEMLKPYPDLQNKIRLYVVKSPVPNAFTTNNGIIFVNIGLLARLENEAQLALILAHEIVHYQKQHVINSYVTNIAIDKAQGDYRKLSMNDRGFAKSTYAKELESEADLLGADIYLQSSYTKDSVQNVFDILKLADHPQSWVTFEKRIFESGQYVFPDTLTLKDVKPVSTIEDYDDSKSTHPNIKKRKAALAEKFPKGGKGDYFKFSKSWFEKVKKTARYELCRLHLLTHAHQEALALALSLQQENPGSPYLKETIAKALYGMAKLKLAGSFTDLGKDWLGEASRVGAFFARQSPFEITVLAMRQLNKYLEENPDNIEIELMLNDLIWTFSFKERDVTRKFARTASAGPIADLKHNYTQYAFMDFKNSTAFFARLDEQVKAAGEYQATTHWHKKKELVKVNKIVVVSPMYKKYDNRRKRKRRHVDEESVLVDINQKISEAAGRLDIATDVINPNAMSSSQVKVMQNNAILSDWIGEQLLSGNVNAVSPIYNEVLALADAYKTDHFAWMGGISIVHTSRGKGLYATMGILLNAMAPYCLARIVSPAGRTLYFALIFNVRTQALELVDFRQMRMKDSHSLMLSNLYYSFFKLTKIPQ